MKRQFTFGTMLAAMLAVGLGAQTPPSSSSQPGQSGRDQDRGTQAVTVTGCLQSASAGSGQSATGDTTSRQGGQSGSQYVLTNASMASGATGSGASGTGTGTSGTGAATGTGTGAGSSATAGSAGAAKRFRLQGGDSSDLQKYVNSRVEVTGTLQPSSERGTTGSSTSGTGTGAGTGTGTGSATGSTSSGSTAGMSSDRNTPTLRVTSVRQVSGSCSGGDGR